MKSLITVFTTMAMILLLPVAPVSADNTQLKDSPQVEIVFTLDTTGSMSHLIEGAKQKIWWIANQVIQGEPAPEIKIGLVGYRDLDDTYVTQVFDLNDDLDEVYQNLASFEANGGGDTPEHVNQALHETLNNISWSKNNDVLKMVFLVGDAPPHVDYNDGYDYNKICREAVAQDIIINTIQCGNDSETTNYWNEIAKLSEGEFAQVDQSGGMRTIPTPMDGDLAVLSGELDATVVFFGDKALREDKASKMTAMAELPPPMAAERVSYKSRKGDMGASDLIGAVGAGHVDLESIEEENLPDEMKGMSPEQKEVFLQKISDERKEIEQKIESLRQNRDEYLRRHIAEMDLNNAFDSKVLQMIRTQAGEKGIVYRDVTP